MSLKATLDRQEIRRFNRRWEDLMEDFPEARAVAVKTMGESARRDLDAQIGRADLESDAKGTVRSWQELRFGSRGGYAALTPQKASPVRTGKKPKSWHGQAVTVKQVTKWLERGHGVRKADTRKDYAWSTARKNRNRRSGLNTATGLRYVKGRMFYSWTKMKAQEHAIDAANEALEIFAEEKGV
ncbi:hypothetical protein [Intestinimonas timonensis]|uniref:hypothetical protein n=1 Tax=Intestinimonas timonensis TaxID=1689270 RepID=UPI0024B240C1|nr:hypothetical protein [Intestinimonas timonensis]